jgi:ectoine hydroxylase-related dioxygenase (phytanoyl-CoA dioxygenase family)
VSFDAINITLPGRKDINWAPWPHVDQAPSRSGLACAQGVILLSDAGPKDGGLIVMRGSSKLFEKYFREHPPAEKPADAPGQFDWYGYKQEELDWFQDHGCELIKIDAQAGDLIVWDSRTIHYASLPENDKIRTVIYAAYTPRALASPEDLKLKQEVFKRWEGTTHWPHCNIFAQGKAYRNGAVCPYERNEPLEKPELTEKVLKLAGVQAY